VTASGDIAASDGGTVSLSSTGALTLTGGTVSADGSGSSVTVTAEASANVTDDLTASDGGTVSLTAAGDLTYEGTLSASGTGSSVSLTGTGTSDVTADITASEDGSVSVSLTGASSALTGTSSLSGGTSVISLSDGAAWNMTASSSVTELTLDGGIVYLGTEASDFASLEPAESSFTPTKLTIGTLSGSGSFYLRAAIEEDYADQIYVSSGTGSHTLYVRSMGTEPSAEAMSAYLVHEESGDASFSLGNESGEVDAGLYVYELAARTVDADSGSGSATEWYLKRVTEESDSDDASASDSGGSSYVLSPSAQSVLIMQGAAAQTANYLGTLNDLRKRLGDVRHQGTSDGLWASFTAARTRFSGYGGKTLKQKTYRANLGVDSKVGGGWLLGGYVSVMTGDQKSSNAFTPITGDTQGEFLGLYATKLFDSGAYLDFVASADSYRDTFRTSMLDGTAVKGRFSTAGFGFPVESGHHFILGEREGWFAEPQVQLAYYRVGSENYTLSSGMTVHQGSADSLTGRLGIVGGRRLLADDGTFLGDLYLKGGVLREFLGDQTVAINGTDFEIGDLGTRWYYGFGGERYLARSGGQSVKLYGQFERTEGNRFDASYEARLGIKVCW
jgi:outer membrane autotransporter protein